jgi:hypothetical protein
MSLADAGNSYVIFEGISINGGTSFLQTNSSLLVNMTCTGPFTTPIITPALVRVLGGVTTLTIQGIQGTFNSSTPSAITLTSSLPITPPFVTVYDNIWVNNGGGTYIDGNFVIDTLGHMTVYVGFNGIFTNNGGSGAGAVGFPALTLSFANNTS